MGNVIAAPIPSRILPAEEYIKEIPELQYLQSLGSTRFMKVASVNSKDGLAVCKVFLPYDPSFSVEPYTEQVVHIRDLLSNEPNCLPFSKVYLTQRCAILMRQYQKQNLYERLSTRPFLTDIEKKWIAFQLFKALAQCEVVGVCHGDIKTQNILVTSSSWVYITDFASFKPACLPSDDPSYFHFFFDTSRRLSCYLAPERFQPSQEIKTHPTLPGDFMDVSKGLTSAMDVFALGCVLIELFTEGRFPFTYERIIRYKFADDQGATQLIQRILEYIPEEWRSIIGAMLNRNPAKRPLGSDLVNRYGSLLFPRIFDRFIYNYMLSFRPRLVTPADVPEEPSEPFITVMEADDVVAKVYSDLDTITEKICEKSDGLSHLGTSVLFISLVTSHVRALKSLRAKLTAMKILQRFAAITDSSIVTDRIIPYLMSFLSDNCVQIRVEGIYVVTAVLSSLNEIPVNENRLFVDYIFPRMKILSLDSSILVRMSLALNLGELAGTSIKFLTQSAANLTEDFLKGTLAVETDDQEKKEEVLTRQELKALHEAVTEIFVNLCGSDNNVKLCLVMPHSLEELCLFFDRQKCLAMVSCYRGRNFLKRATDVLLSHMITFLNDKVDWRLRAAFFQRCTITAKYVGRQSAFMLRSLLQQGLHDCEEFVQLRTLQSIYELCDEHLLDKTSICELLPDVVPFLAHPNEWLRLAVVNIVCLLDKIFNIADVYCKLQPVIKGYLNENLICFSRKLIVSACLKPPIPRNIWSYIVEKTPVDQLMKYIINQHMLISLNGGSNSVFTANRSDRLISPPLKSCLERLKNLGLNDDYEEKLIKFGNILTKMYIFRSSISSNTTKELENDVIDLRKLPLAINLRSFDLTCDIRKSMDLQMQLISSITPAPSVTTIDSDTKDILMPQGDEQGTNVTTSYGYIGIPMSSGTIRSSASIAQISELLMHKRERYMKCQQHVKFPNVGASALISRSSNSGMLSSLRGTKLVAHLHEHCAAITSMSLNSTGTGFASASSDGTVKIWSMSKFGGQLTTAIRADATYAYRRRIFYLEYLRHGGDNLAIAADDKSVNIIDARRVMLLKKTSFEENDGPPIQLFAADNFLYVLTHHGNVYCLDCRMPLKNLGSVWEYKANNGYGLITSFCVDPGGRNWMVLTSTGGDMILLDLRFRLEVKNWQHPNCRLLHCWPSYSASEQQLNEVWTASYCSGELTRWKLGTGERSFVIWPCSEKAVCDYSEENRLVTTALTTCQKTGRIFTGDSLGAIRSYNLNNEESCYYLSGPELKTAEEISQAGDPASCIKFNKVVVKTVDTIYQSLRVLRQRHNSTTPSNTTPLDNQVTICHRSAISKLFCHGNFLFSSSRDGIIKVWS
uniref:non-specific serine/threonine protein kinase n=1 Tax=Syphacia muris TaxID=451379 RepID=A0A0N5ASF0_9BILA